MYIFLPIIILSALGILVIFVRKIPRARQVPIHSASAFYDSWVYKVPHKIRHLSFKGIRESFLFSLEKILRKFKVMALRFENKISDLTVKLKTKRQSNDGANVSFSEKSQADNKDFVKDLGGALDKPIDFSEKTEKSANKTNKDDKLEIDQKEFESQEEKILGEIKKNPKNKDAYKELGFLYLKHKDYKDAKNSLEQAVKLGSRDDKIKEALEEVHRYL